MASSALGIGGLIIYGTELYAIRKAKKIQGEIDAHCNYDSTIKYSPEKCRKLESKRRWWRGSD